MQKLPRRKCRGIHYLRAECLSPCNRLLKLRIWSIDLWVFEIWFYNLGHNWESFCQLFLSFFSHLKSFGVFKKMKLQNVSCKNRMHAKYHLAHVCKTWHLTRFQMISSNSKRNVPSMTSFQADVPESMYFSVEISRDQTIPN